MNILRKFETVGTGYRSDGGFGPELMLAAITEETRLSDISSTYANEYRMEVHLGITFTATPDQYTRAKENAYRHLTHMIFGDIKAEFYELQSIIYNGHQREALKKLDEIRKLMG